MRKKKPTERRKSKVRKVARPVPTNPKFPNVESLLSAAWALVIEKHGPQSRMDRSIVRIFRRKR